MTGWPDRITRDDLGPELADLLPAPNGQTFLGAVVFTLAWWVLAGAARPTTRAWAGVDGAADSVLGHGEAWYPNADGPPPTLVKNGTGDYTLTYVNAPNESGQTKALGLSYAKAHAQTTSNINAVATVSGNDVTVHTFTADTGAAVDATVFVEVF